MLAKRLLWVWYWPWAAPVLRHQSRPQPFSTALLVTLFWSLVGIGRGPVLAQPRSQPATNPIPQELETLLENRPKTAQVTANTPSQQGFTVPSLWWTNQQFGNKLVLDWRAYGIDQVGNQQINVVVRPELWTRYTYYERYAFVLKFGSDASNFGYQLLVFDSQNLLLGAYTCDFTKGNPNFLAGLQDAQSQPIPRYANRSSAQPLPCRLWLNPNAPSPVL